MATDTLDSVSANRLLETCPPGSLPATVNKQLLYPCSNPTGSPSPPYPPGSRLQFHFKTTQSSAPDVTIDDSRRFPKPIELILGKKFKVEIWELALNTMRVGEVAKFVCPTSMCVVYPMVAKVLRDTYLKKSCSSDHQHRSSSCCGSLLNGTGHPDLDVLLRSPASLTFTFELVQVELPGSYEPESWYMTDEQKSTSISSLQELGNKLFSENSYEQASAKYFEAISRLEQLITKEVPGSSEQKEIQNKKIPLLLNYAFCKQKLKDYHEAIIHINSVLELDSKSVKGYFRRAQCYKYTGSFNNAKEDFQRALELDPSLSKTVKSELDEMKKLEASAVQSDKQTYQKMFS